MPSPRPQGALALSAVLASVLAAGCGGSNKAPIEEQSIAEESQALRKELVSDGDLKRFPAGSPQRALFAYWSAVQYGDLRQAVLAYDPRLVRVVGIDRLGSALRGATPLYRQGKPDITSTRRDGDTTTIRYFARLEQTEGGSQVSPETMSFRRFAGLGLRIVYSSALDGELRAGIQKEVQDSIRPNVPPGAKAIAAGNRAARLQSKYLAEVNGGRGGQSTR